MIVFMSGSLEKRYPHIFNLFKGILDDKDITFRTLPGSNIWCRDWAPIKTKSGYTKFTYRDTEDFQRFPQLMVPSEVWHPYCDNESHIILDGGNIEQNDHTVLMTSMVFNNNPSLCYDEESIKKFCSCLEMIFDKNLIILPPEPYDTLGHIDGIARFVDSKKVLINDYSKQDDPVMDTYQKKITDQLSLNGFDVITIPNSYHERELISEREFRRKYPDADEFNVAIGYHINFYKVEDIIFMPAFDLPSDNVAYHVLIENFPNCEVIACNCLDLSMEGGLLNCVTFEHDKPGRII